MFVCTFIGFLTFHVSIISLKILDVRIF